MPFNLKVPSDNLTHSRAMLAFPGFQDLMKPPELLRLVVDANAAIREVRWLVKKRISLTARTALQEAMASGTIIAFAPPHLDVEVCNRLIDIANREQLNIDLLLETWASYRASIRFVDVRPSDIDGAAVVSDPDDLPYVSVYKSVGASAVITADAHLEQMGAIIVPLEMAIAARDYARCASIAYNINVSGAGFVYLGIGAARGVASFSHELYKAYRKLPAGLQICLILFAIILVAHPTSRKRVGSALDNFLSALGRFLHVVLPVITDLRAESLAAAKQAEIAWNRIPPKIRSGKTTLRAYLVAVLSSAEEPLSVNELESRLRIEGAATSAKTFRKYLLQVLRNQPLFAEDYFGRWTIVRNV